MESKDIAKTHTHKLDLAQTGVMMKRLREPVLEHLFTLKKMERKNVRNRMQSTLLVFFDFRDEDNMLVSVATKTVFFPLVDLGCF